MNYNPFQKHSDRAQLENKDYTKFIKWTPIRVAIAAFVIFIPYAVLVYAVASSTSIMAVIPMLVAPALIAVFTGIIYWLSKAVL